MQQGIRIEPRRPQKSGFGMLAAAPHRIMFFCGALQALAAVAWWLSDLLGRYGNMYRPLIWSLPSPFAHAYLLGYGLFPFFIFGFLLTAVPNWLGVKPRRTGYVAAAVAMGLGLLLVYAGLFTVAAVAAAGVALHLAGWAIALAEIVRLIVKSDAADKRYPRLLVTELAAGWTGAAAFLLFLLTDAGELAEFARRAALWFFLLPIFFTVSHRMVPFFASRVLDPYAVYRPRWSLVLVLAGSIAHGALEMAGAWGWLWLVDAPMLATVLHLVFRWGLMRCFKARLLAVLHLSLLGLALSLALSTAQSVAWFAYGHAMLGTAPTHAMTLCYFAAMLIAMVSRVSLGHSGHSLIADNWTWLSFWGMVITGMVRVLAEIPLAGGKTLTVLIPLAAFLWFSFFLLWASRYVPLYLRPKADGTPG
jgi:uncharacterized protein involved in response to NO